MAENDRHFEEYFRVLSGYMSPEELRALLKCGTPEEMEQLLRWSLENFEEYQLLHAQLTQLIAEKQAHAQFWRVVRQFWTITWQVGIGALGLVAGLNGLPQFLEWTKGLWK